MKDMERKSQGEGALRRDRDWILQCLQVQELPFMGQVQVLSGQF
jgi:hypothetical protein